MGQKRLNSIALINVERAYANSMQVSIGPDNIPNIVLKEFAPELAIVIQDIYNQSLIESYVPPLVKMFHHFPYTKRNPSTINGNRFAPDFTHVYIG